MEYEKNLLPLFPLNLVVLPGEKIPLHIFEPRYKQLINDCLENDSCFGIPYVKDIKICDIGAKVKIDEIMEVYASGEMDIIVEGMELFHLIECGKTICDKLYSGGIISPYYPETKALDTSLYAFYCEYNKCYNNDEHDETPDIVSLTTLDIAKNCCLSSQQKHWFLCLKNDQERQAFLLNQLKLNVIVKKQEAYIEQNLYLN